MTDKVVLSLGMELRRNRREPHKTATFSHADANSRGSARRSLGSPASAGSHKIVRERRCPFVHFCATLPSVNGREFITRVRRLGAQERDRGQVRPHEGQR